MRPCVDGAADQTTFWVTPHYTTDDGYIKGEWTPVFNVDTYKVQISYSRDGIQPWRVVATFDTNRTEFRFVDAEQGGRYLVRVRVKNRCDGMGPWSEALRIYVGGGSDASDAPPPPPPPPPGDDDDGNNGHGNDDDHDDESNPGGGGGSD